MKQKIVVARIEFLQFNKIGNFLLFFRNKFNLFQQLNSSFVCDGSPVYPAFLLSSLFNFRPDKQEFVLYYLLAIQLKYKANKTNYSFNSQI